MEKVEDGGGKGRIVLATVKGDVHDIGKNLVDIILTNNGYEVHNLGIKIGISEMIEKALEVKADAIGMSGLLVKSTLIMRDNLEELNDRSLSNIPVVLGGAALTRSYVERDLREVYEGRLFYGKDAFEGLRVMDRLGELKRTGDDSVFLDDDYLIKGVAGAVLWKLLDMYGFKVYTLIGGYKKFRNHVLDTFKKPYHFNIIGGYTGSGKTELLKTLKEKGEKVIDLEAIANHKGSAFGAIGLPPQPTQEMFENLLSTELSAISSQEGLRTTNYELLTSCIWLEDESQRIGLINIPGDLWKNMRQSKVWFLDIPFEERLKHITPEYGILEQEKLIAAIERISQKLGHLNAKTAILLLKEGKITESFEILLKYYDKFYFRSLHNREGLNSLLHTVNCISTTSENADELLRQTKQLAQ